MNDPCRAGKCLKYPICRQAIETPDCILIHKYIRDYIYQHIREEKIELALFTAEVYELWRYIKPIFPNLSKLTYCLQRYRYTFSEYPPPSLEKFTKCTAITPSEEMYIPYKGINLND